MRVSVLQEQLADNLNSLVKQVPSPKSYVYNEALKCVKLETVDAGKGLLRVGATNGELTTWVIQESRNAILGEFVVPFAPFREMINLLPPIRLDLSINESGDLVIDADNTIVRFHPYTKSEFPKQLEEVGGVHQLTINGKQFIEGLQQIAFNMISKSEADSRPALHGVLFKIDDRTNTLTLVASNSVSIIEKIIKLDEPQNFFCSVIIPFSTIKMLCDLDELDIPMLIRISAETIGFQFDHTQIISQLVDETYPALDKYFGHVPAPDYAVTVNIKDLKKAIKRVDVIKEAGHPIWFTAEAYKLRLHNSSIETGDIDELIEAEVCGDNLPIGFILNIKQVSDFLNTAGKNAKRVTFFVDNPTIEEIMLGEKVIFTAKDKPVAMQIEDDSSITYWLSPLYATKFDEARIELRESLKG